MSPSLSVILPVRNAESKLAAVVHLLLEVTSELTDDLELMIVDDGSTDNTEEVAMNLQRQFPQVSTRRYAKQAGHVVAVRTGIMSTRGDIVLVQNIDAPISAESIRELWAMRIDEVMAFGRSDAPNASISAPAMHSQPTWSGGTQMLRRDAIELFEQPNATIPPEIAAEPAPPVAAQTANEPAKQLADQPAVQRVRRTDSSEKSSAPAIIQPFHGVEMQPDR